MAIAMLDTPEAIRRESGDTKLGFWGFLENRLKDSEVPLGALGLVAGTAIMGVSSLAAMTGFGLPIAVITAPIGAALMLGGGTMLAHGGLSNRR